VKRQNDARTAFLINGVTFDPPTVPVLLQILSGTKSASDLLPAGSVYPLAPNQSVELTIPGGAIGGPVSSIPCASRPDDMGTTHATISICVNTPFSSTASRSLAWTCILRSPQRRQCLVQLCKPRRPRRREHRQHGRRRHDPLLHRQPWPLVLPLPHRLARGRVRDFHPTFVPFDYADVTPSGFAVVFAEDVPDVPSRDFTNGAFADCALVNE
jgi:hypothetical protein